MHVLVTLHRAGFIGTINYMKYCQDCGKEKSMKGIYCKSCGYIHRKRPSGLTYIKHKENPTSFKKGSVPWNKGDSKGWVDAGYRKVSIDGEDIREHRRIVEETFGIKLESNKIIHHKDGNKINNSLDNLEVMTASEHMKLHWQLRR